MIVFIAIPYAIVLVHHYSIFWPNMFCDISRYGYHDNIIGSLYS